MDYDVKDLKLASKGELRMEWAGRFMPVLSYIKKNFAKEKPLKGAKISACLHVTSETGNLVEALMLGGADVRLTASNPLSTQDDVAAALVKHYRIPVFAIKGEDNKTYYRHIHQALAHSPHITMDDGADLVCSIHSERKELLSTVIGGTEETTTGVIRLNILLAGLNFVIAGYGWCGRGLATRARGAGAKVIVCEVDPLRALEAVMDGFQVMGLKEASKIGDIFITVTGDKNVVTKEHFLKMKDGAIVANSGHFNVEIDIVSLRKLSTKRRKIRDFVEEYTLESGKKIYLLGEGRLINLAAAEGHPAVVMDMSFANQALCMPYLYRQARDFQPKVYSVPKEIDEEIAVMKLRSMGVKIDKLTAEQKKYLTAWEKGT
jgi:adenosylhomocysteinase